MSEGVHVQAGVAPLGKVARPPTWVLALLFSPPLVVALVSRLFNGYWWWNDFDAMACAGVRAAHGLSAYAAHATCAGLRPADFVYPPQIAWAFSALTQAFGVGPVKLAYVAVYIAASLWLGWLLFVRKTPHADVRTRLLALGLVTGGVIACGNVAILCHALIAASLLGFRRTRAPFILAVAFAALFKPVFVVALVVLVIERADWRTRLKRLAGAGALMAGLAALILLTGRDELGAWSGALHRTVLENRPGSGFLGWAAALGLPEQSTVVLAGWAAFAAAMTAAGAVLVRAAPFETDEVWLFGLGLAQLINPRLMGYDLQMLAPTVALAMAASSRLQPSLGATFRRALALVCIAALVFGCLWQVSLAALLAPAALSLILLALSGALARRAPRKLPVRATAVAEAAPMLSVVICTLDEHESIAGVIREASAALADIPYELIVVDDSPDERTAEAVLACSAAFPEVRLVRRRDGRGLASAAIAGWDAARGGLLAIMDGDGQHDPARLRALYDRLLNDGADIGVASRYCHSRGTGLNGMRDRISRAGTGLARLALGAPTTDPLSGLFMMRRDWFEAVRPRLSGVGFKILVDVMVSGTRRPATVEVETALRRRLGGASKLDFRVMADLAALLIEKRTNGVVSTRLALFLGVGLTGVVVNLLTLEAATAEGATFWLALGVAIFASMTSNFFINNALTFRDMRLRGAAMVRGLLAFYFGCLGGAGVNWLLADAAKQLGVHQVAAALLGVIAGALFNYGAAHKLTWSSARNQPDEHAAAKPSLTLLDAKPE